MGFDSVLLPQRVEFADYPNKVDRFYIDGPIDPVERQRLVAPGPVRLLMAPWTCCCGASAQSSCWLLFS